MNKSVRDFMAITASLGGFGTYFTMDGLCSKSGTQRNYSNKNSNIEYYTDEKGNIRKRKKVTKHE